MNHVPYRKKSHSFHCFYPSKVVTAEKKKKRKRIRFKIEPEINMISLGNKVKTLNNFLVSSFVNIRIL